jgi:hypothetical protein
LTSFVHTDSRGGYNDDCIRFCLGSYNRVSRCHRDDIEKSSLELGVASLAGAAMIHTGATVFDHMLHGSFFHATGDSVNMTIQERLRLIPYEKQVLFSQLPLPSSSVYLSCLSDKIKPWR